MVPLIVCALAGAGGVVARTVLAGTPLPDPAQALARALSGEQPSTGQDAVVAARRNEILRLLQQHYYRPVDVGRLAAEPIEQIPAVLGDPYTHYLKPETLAAWDRADAGRYVGIGVVVDTLAGHGLRVTSVLPGSPAAAAGLQPGDRITAVDGHDTTTMATADALELVRGQAGSRVTVTVQGQDGRRTLRLTRTEVKAQLVTSTLTPVASGAGEPPALVGVVRLAEFDQNVGDQVRAATADLVRHGATRLVLDLRGNPGGLIDQTLPVVAAFTPAGTPVYSQQGLHAEHRTYRTRQQPVTTRLPLTVLVDHDTASAAEIVTGALQDAHRATVTGTTTYGKGVMQQIWPLPSGGGIKLTVAEFLTPTGHHIQHTGIHPDRP